jgi:hypothetical protein
LVDALLIMGVVVGNAAIGYKTETEAEKTIESLQTLVRPSAQVRRAGRMVEISAEEVALGDLLVLRPGSYVAADARLVEASHLSLDESALTGESLPVSKSTGALTSPGPLGDRVNMVFRGTLVTGGEGLAVVVATGSFTEIGRIQAMIGEAAESPETPLQRQLGALGDQLVVVCLGVCGVAFVAGSLWGMGFPGDAPHLHFPGGRGGARRAAHGGHHHPGLRDQGHAAAPRPHPQPARRGDPRVGEDRLPGQDRHHHQKRNVRGGSLRGHAGFQGFPGPLPGPRGSGDPRGQPGIAPASAGVRAVQRNGNLPGQRHGMSFGARPRKTPWCAWPWTPAWMCRP